MFDVRAGELSHNRHMSVIRSRQGQGSDGSRRTGRGCFGRSIRGLDRRHVGHTGRRDRIGRVGMKALAGVVETVNLHMVNFRLKDACDGVSRRRQA